MEISLKESRKAALKKITATPLVVDTLTNVDVTVSSSKKNTRSTVDMGERFSKKKNNSL